jgi:hypothetical protein
VIACDGRSEAIAASRERLYELGARVGRCERSAQRGDALREVVFRDVAVRPDVIDELLLRYHAAGVFDQEAERVEGLSAEGDLVASCGEDALARVEAEAAESIDRVHRSFRTNSVPDHHAARTRPQIVRC